MIVFADSSALVTHYAPHEHDVVPFEATIAVSVIARVEVASALWRQAREGLFAVEDAGVFVRNFAADFHGTDVDEPCYEPVAVSGALLEHAAGLVATHGLRTLDAIQLASALAVRGAEPECRTMVVLDERLRHAAATEGFGLIPA